MVWQHRLYFSMASAHISLHSKNSDMGLTVTHLPAVPAVSQPSNLRQEALRRSFDVMLLSKAILQLLDTLLSHRACHLEAI